MKTEREREREREKRERERERGFFLLLFFSSALGTPTTQHIVGFFEAKKRCLQVFII